jgi:hypothetical protein
LLKFLSHNDDAGATVVQKPTAVLCPESVIDGESWLKQVVTAGITPFPFIARAQ